MQCLLADQVALYPRPESIPILGTSIRTLAGQDMSRLLSDVAGTTFTMAVLLGSLLTVANVGDSRAFMDTGSELVELTTSHRIEDNVGVCLYVSMQPISP